MPEMLRMQRARVCGSSWLPSGRCRFIFVAVAQDSSYIGSCHSPQLELHRVEGRCRGVAQLGPSAELRLYRIDVQPRSLRSALNRCATTTAHINSAPHTLICSIFAWRRGRFRLKITFQIPCCSRHKRTAPAIEWFHRAPPLESVDTHKFQSVAPKSLHFALAVTTQWAHQRTRQLPRDSDCGFSAP